MSTLSPEHPSITRRLRSTVRTGTPPTPKLEHRHNNEDHTPQTPTWDFATFAGSLGVGEDFSLRHVKTESIDLSDFNFVEEETSLGSSEVTNIEDKNSSGSSVADEVSDKSSELTDPSTHDSDNEDDEDKRRKFRSKKSKSIFGSFGQDVASGAKGVVSSAIKGTKNYVVDPTIKGTKYAVGGVVNGTKYAVGGVVDGTVYVAKGGAKIVTGGAKMAVNGAKGTAKGVVKGTKLAVEGVTTVAETTYRGVKRTGTVISDMVTGTPRRVKSSDDSVSSDTASDPNFLDDSEFDEAIHDVEAEVEKLNAIALSVTSPTSPEEQTSTTTAPIIPPLRTSRTRGLAIIRDIKEANQSKSDPPPLSPRNIATTLLNKKERGKSRMSAPAPSTTNNSDSILSPKSEALDSLSLNKRDSDPGIITGTSTKSPSGMQADLVPYSYYLRCQKAKSLAPLYRESNMRNYQGIDEPISSNNFVMDEDTKVIRAGTLDKLIEAVTNHKTYDNEFLDVFVLTYRSFTTPEELLEKLILRYNTPPPMPPRRDKQKLDETRDPIVVNININEDLEDSICIELVDNTDQDIDYEYVNEFYENNRHLFVQFVKTFLFRVRMRVCIFIKNWMERHFADFREDRYARKRLQEFIFREMPNSNMETTSIRLRALFDSNSKRRDTFTAQQIARLKEVHELQRLTEKSSNRFSIHSNFKLQIKGNKIINTLSNENLKILPLHMFKSTDLVNSLTIIQFSIFKNIRPKEFLNQSWMKSDRRTKAPNIFKSIQRSNQVGMWVATEILSVKDLKERAKVIQKFIKCAIKCERIRNFNTMIDIVSGLNSNPIHRLTKSWEQVDQDFQVHFKRLTDLASPKKSYSNLRTATKEGGVPCMPYIGMHLTDVLFIEDGNKDKTSNGLINFTKRRLLGGVIRDIQVYQQMPFDLTEQPMLTTRLSTPKFRDLDSLLDISQQLEPPVQKKKKKKNVVDEETA